MSSLGHWGMTSSNYDRVTVVTNSDTEEWQAVATIVLLLSHSDSVRVCDSSNYDRSHCLSFMSVGDWGMTSSGYDRVTACHKLGHWVWMTGSDTIVATAGHKLSVTEKWPAVTTIVSLPVTNSDTEEWQAVTTIVATACHSSISDALWQQ